MALVHEQAAGRAAARPRPTRDAQPEKRRPGRWVIRVLMGTFVAVAACGGTPAPSALPTPASAAPVTPTASDRQTGAPPSPAQAFVDAWVAEIEAYDSGVTELLIANPLAEYDLVGLRLIDLVARTRELLSTVQPPSGLRAEVRALDDAMAATLARLEAIDPHGPRTEQAAAYRDALDDWVDHVRPIAQAIRDALGLAPVPAGDLQL